MAGNNSLLAPLTEKYCGLRLIGIPDFYEAVCWAIIGQQINLDFAGQIKRNLILGCGSTFEFAGQQYFSFPKPEQVLSLGEEKFAAYKFSRQKTAYILEVSRKIENGKLEFGSLKQMDFFAVKANLLANKGIANWTAEYVLMKTFRFPNAFPVQDAGLHNALKNRLNLSQKPGLETIRELATPWKGHEAYATFYLWRSLYD
jgi:DNA-3-methyladenine glycosylase II